MSLVSVTTHAQVSFGPPTEYANGDPGNDRGTAAADFDGDGDMDLALVGSILLRIRMNNGDGTLDEGASFTTSTIANAIATGDIEPDGDIDIVVAGPSLWDVTVMVNDGTGRFTIGDAWSAGEGTGVALGDFDGDGDLDVVSADWGFTIRIARNNGDGTFASPLRINVFNRPRSVAVADLNGDGMLDIVTANDLSSDGVSVVLNNGDFSFAVPVGYLAGENPRSITVADLDGDGDNDLAVANASTPPVNGPPSVSVHLNTGTGTFLEPMFYPAGAQPMSIVAADVDGDGDPDLVVANCNECLGPFTPNAGLSNASVLVNDGSAGMAPPLLFPVGPGDAIFGGPRNILATDLDGDALVDLVAANFTHDDVFDPDWSLSTLINLTQAPCQADLNSDGELDFFDVQEFLNAFAAGNLIADFNDDGLLDFFDVAAFLNAFAAGCP